MDDREIERRMRRAIISRFGEAVTPYRFERIGNVAGDAAYQMTDTESGHWIKASINCGGKRLHVWAERDASKNDSQ